MEIEKNTNEAVGRSASDVLDVLSQFIQRNDVSLKLPMADSKVTISSRNLDNDEIDFKVKFAGGASESRKSKLKKIAIPILTFVLLKAITLVPLGLGILGIKAFNALQLSFFSFVISVGLATFQLCRKVSVISVVVRMVRIEFWFFFFSVSLQLALDHQHPQIAAAGPWDTRSFATAFNDDSAQDIAYNAYQSEN